MSPGEPCPGARQGRGSTLLGLLGTPSPPLSPGDLFTETTAAALVEGCPGRGHPPGPQRAAGLRPPSCSLSPSPSPTSSPIPIPVPIPFHVRPPHKHRQEKQGTYIIPALAFLKGQNRREGGLVRGAGGHSQGIPAAEGRLTDSSAAGAGPNAAAGSRGCRRGLPAQPMLVAPRGGQAVAAPARAQLGESTSSKVLMGKGCVQASETGPQGP